MKKRIFRIAAWALVLLALAGVAQAGDVPTCPLVSWEEIGSASLLSWAQGGSSTLCGASAAQSACAGASSGQCASTGAANQSCASGSACSSANGATYASGIYSGATYADAVTSATASAFASSGTQSGQTAQNACTSCGKVTCAGNCATVASGEYGGWDASVYAFARCGSCNSTSCDGSCGASALSSCGTNGWTPSTGENCIVSIGACDNTPTVCPTGSCQSNTSPTQSEQNYTAQSVSSQESALYQMINSDRQKNGVAALPLDTELSALARAKSEDMVENNYFAHESPTYGKAADMLEDAYYEFTSVGENIARNGSIEKAHAALMSSSSHVRNILGSQWKTVGVGVANDQNGYPYVTELFVR